MPIMYQVGKNDKCTRTIDTLKLINIPVQAPLLT